MKRVRAAGAVLALAFLAAACGHDSASTTATTAAPAETTATTAAPAAGADTTVAGTTIPATTTKPDPCKGATLTDTDIGVTKDSITVVVMADVGSELAPGLFQGNLDGVDAWAKTVNARGGVGCRKLVVEHWDSKINATESTNGFLEACSKALAMVGSNSLFIGDTTALNTCPDKTGNKIGFPDIPERAVDAVHQCSKNVFTIGGVAGSCPYSGKGPRDFVAVTGPLKKVQELVGYPLHGVFLIPGDLPSTIASSMPTIRAANALGVKSDGEKAVSGRDPQAKYGAYVQIMKTASSNFAQDGSNDQAFIKMRTEAAAQGLTDSKIVWMCSLSCYTAAYQKDPNSDGTYLWLPFVPYEERTAVPEIDNFLTAIGQPFPQSWAVGAYNSGLAFEQAVNSIVATDGPNAITRANLLAAMAKITSFDANGFTGAVDYSKKSLSPCYVLMQLQKGKYVRLWPKEVGKMDCDPGNLSKWSGDASAEYKG
jgi:ABC-type branched-subunit amino acid transport system substrate-binding protein